MEEKVHKGISAVVAALIAVLGIAGCGGGNSSISKAEYQQQIELVCNKGLKEREEFFKEVTQEYTQQSKNATPKELAEIQAKNVRRLMAVYKGTTEEIADLGLPEQGEKKAEELVKGREDGVAKVEEETVRGVAQFSAIMAKPNKIAEDFFEVTSCAK
jgi:hypothetical protein